MVSKNEFNSNEEIGTVDSIQEVECNIQNIPDEWIPSGFPQGWKSVLRPGELDFGPTNNQGNWSTNTYKTKFKKQITSIIHCQQAQLQSNYMLKVKSRYQEGMHSTTMYGSTHLHLQSPQEKVQQESCCPWTM